MHRHGYKLEGLKEARTNSSPGKQSPYRDLNSGSPEYKPVVDPTGPGLSLKGVLTELHYYETSVFTFQLNLLNKK
jgi:hypothetical protein